MPACARTPRCLEAFCWLVPSRVGQLPDRQLSLAQQVEDANPHRIADRAQTRGDQLGELRWDRADEGHRFSTIQPQDCGEPAGGTGTRPDAACAFGLRRSRHDPHRHPRRRHRRHADRQPAAARLRRRRRDRRRRPRRPPRLSARSAVRAVRAGRPGRRSSARAPRSCTTGSSSGSPTSTASRPRADEVHLADGSVLGYDVLVVATGARLVPEETEGARQGRTSSTSTRSRARPRCATRSRASTAAGSSSTRSRCRSSARSRRSSSASSRTGTCAGAACATRSS